MLKLHVGAVYKMCRPVLVRKNADGIYLGRAQYVHKRDETEKQETVLRVVWWKAQLLWYSAAKKRHNISDVD